VRAAYEAPRSDRLKEHVRANYTWRRAAERTREGYQLALDLHAASSPRDRQEDAAAALKRHCDWLERLAADRLYEVQRLSQLRDETAQYARHLENWGQDLESRLAEAASELRRTQEEFQRVTSRRLYRWGEAVSRTGWGISRALRPKR
jgi:hypothetical protein